VAISRGTAGIHPGAFGYSLWELFSHIEDRVLLAIGQATARTLPNANTLMHLGDQHQALSALTRAVNDLLEGLDARASRYASQAVLDAARGGRVAAVRELEAIAGRTDLPEVFRQRMAQARAALTGSEEGLRFGPVARIAEALQGRLGEMRLPIVRAARDAFQEITAKASAAAVVGVDAQRKAAAAAYQELAGRGLTTFTDRAGKRWALDSYVDMATRTAIVQSAVEAHNDQLGQLGIDLVIVSDSPRECPLCRPWEGKILARTGPGGAHDVQVQHAINDGESVTVHVAGTVADATSAGLFHPNCTHTIGAYLPGVTKPFTTDTANPDGYAAQQRQRTLERRLRAARRAQEGLPNWADRQFHDAASARVKSLRGQLSEHLSQNPDLPRQRAREQVAQGFGPSKAKPPAKQLAPRPAQYYPDGTAPGSEDLMDAARIIETSPDVRREPLAEMGQVGVPERITLPDGRVVFGKTNGPAFAMSGEQVTDAEQLAGMVGHALGAPVPRLYRDGPVHLYTEWVSGKPGSTVVTDEYTYEPDTDLGHHLTYGQAGKRLGLLDLLTENGDRHTGNWLAVGEPGSETLMGVDQGLAYSGYHYDPAVGGAVYRMRGLVDWYRGASEDERLSHLASNQAGWFADNWFDLQEIIDSNGRNVIPRGDAWTSADVAEVRRRLQELAPMFAHLNRSADLEYSLLVLDTLGQYANGTESIFNG